MKNSRLTSVLFALFFILQISVPGQAAVVTNTNNTGNGSLRAAIAAAVPGEVITFDSSLSGQTITLGGTELVINKLLWIDGLALAGGITISGNNASRVFFIENSGFAILQGLTITGGAAGYGGGIRNNGNLSLTECAVINNHATFQGGGVYNSFGNTQIRNVTLVGNSAGDAGGGLYNDSGGIQPLVYTTISGNSATNFGGGIANNGASANLNIENSLVAGNTGPAAGSGADIGNRNAATVSPTGANLIGDNDTVSTAFPAGPLVGTTASPLDPLLAPLGDYAGPRQTRLPLPGSAAIDAAIATPVVVPNDARGFARPFGPASDLGAVEVTDSDGDGLDDGYELKVTGTNPYNVDSDGDGLVDGADGVVAVGVYPGGIDANGDGFVDGEAGLGTDPTVSNKGDVAPRGNPDNVIDVADLLVLTRLAVGVILPAALEARLGDVNGDTLLNVADVLGLLPAVMP